MEVDEWVAEARVGNLSPVIFTCAPHIFKKMIFKTAIG